MYINTTVMQKPMVAKRRTSRITTGGAGGLEVTVLMTVLTTVTCEPESDGPLLISFVVVVVTVSCWLDGCQSTTHSNFKSILLVKFIKHNQNYYRKP